MGCGSGDGGGAGGRFLGGEGGGVPGLQLAAGQVDPEEDDLCGPSESLVSGGGARDPVIARSEVGVELVIADDERVVVTGDCRD